MHAMLLMLEDAADLLAELPALFLNMEGNIQKLAPEPGQTRCIYPKKRYLARYWLKNGRSAYNRR